MNSTLPPTRPNRVKPGNPWLSVLGLLTLLVLPSSGATLDPIALWRGEGNANDSVGTHHGVLVNGTSFAPGIGAGQTGEAFSLDGSDDEVRFPNSLDFNLTNGVTVAGWMKTSAPAEFAGLLDKFEQAGQVTGFQISMSGNNGFPPNRAGILRSDLGTGASYVTAFNPRAVDDGVPHHFALTCDGRQAILHVDGIAGDPVAATNWVATNSAEVVLGSDTDASGRHFNGQLDEVAIYARALSATEVQALAGKPVLQIVLTGPNEAAISWPQAAVGFRLEVNDGFAPTGWVTASSGTNNPASLSTATAARFYRLTKP